jgi:predicted GIY-YIG superfamily endonuclease
MAFFVYVLLNPQGKTYIGQSADLGPARRHGRHNVPKT